VTRVAPVDPPTADHPAAIQAREPRPPRAPRTPAPAAPAPREQPRRGEPARASKRRKGRIRRTFGALVAIVLVGAGIGVAYVSTQDSGSAVQLRDVVYDEVDRAVDELRKLVEDNTR
jgi:hypothetical protein